MYSEEIKQLLEVRNYLVSVKEYMDICNSPQVNHIFYENDAFVLWTDDGYKFVLKIKI